MTGLINLLTRGLFGLIIFHLARNETLIGDLWPVWDLSRMGKYGFLFLGALFQSVSENNPGYRDISARSTKILGSPAEFLG